MDAKDTADLVSHSENPSVTQPVAPSVGDSSVKSDAATLPHVSLGEVNLSYTESTTDSDIKNTNQSINDKHDSNQNKEKGPEEQSEKNSDSEKTAVPVYYTSNGTVHISTENVLVTKENGNRVIITPLSQVQNIRGEIHETHLKRLKWFSILAVILFFPLGIVALVFALKAESEFNCDAPNRNPFRIRKHAKLSKKFAMFSVLAALLTLGIILIIVENYG